MRTLTVFNSITLDGYFSGPRGDISWAHDGAPDPEFNAFIAGNAKGGGVLLFGRVTYDLMKSYWPSEQASKNDPVVAERMNNLPKIVFSKTLPKAEWKNTRLVSADPVGEVRALKNEAGDDMVIMGSGSIVALLTQAGLIDTYQLLIKPVAIGEGKTMFHGIRDRVTLELQSTRTFANGTTFMTYTRP